MPEVARPLRLTSLSSCCKQYLSDKQRSGVVELGPAARGGPPRTLYVIPPSRSVCDELRIAWEPQVRCPIDLQHDYPKFCIESCVIPPSRCVCDKLRIAWEP